MHTLERLQLDPEHEHLREGAVPYTLPVRPGEKPKEYAKRQGVPLHRIIMGVEGIPASVIMVDHIDGDGLNNRRENLRLATASQNAMNRRTRSDNSSGARGVSWRKDLGKWEAYAKVNGKQRKGGCFEKLEDAAEAARKLREEMHGRFARHD